jgi:hypothetical protein
VHLAPLAVEIFEKLPRLASKKNWIFTTGLGGADTPVSGFGRGRERIAAAMAEMSGEVIPAFRQRYPAAGRIDAGAVADPRGNTSRPEIGHLL